MTIYHYRAGMPQLEPAGLSQNWLLKECGDHHWRALANLLGLDGPDFRDPDGSPVHASFLVVKLEKLALHTMANDQEFRLLCDIKPLSKQRFLSCHQLQINGQCCGELVLVSTLVKHDEPGDNLSLSPAELSFEGSYSTVPEQWLALINDSRQLRKDILLGDWSFSGQAENTDLAFVYTPTPSIDFNGAGLLYFANYQAIVERAEWSWLASNGLGAVTERQLNYYANLNIGDQIEVVCRAIDTSDSSLKHWLSLYRSSDKEKIADVLSKRVKVNHG